MSEKMREALKLARKAMRECGDALTAANIDGCPTYDDAMDAIDAALAEQPAQGEAVACVHHFKDVAETTSGRGIVRCIKCNGLAFCGAEEDLVSYTAPPAPSVPPPMPLPETSTGNAAEDMRLFGKAQGWNLCRAAMLAAAPEVPRG